MQEMSHTSFNEYSQSSKVSPKDFTDFLRWCLIILTRFFARTFCKILLMFKLYTSTKNSFNTAFFTKAIIEEKIHFSISFIFCFQSFKINLYLAVKINQTQNLSRNLNGKFPLLPANKNHLSFNVFKQNIDTVVVYDIDSLNYKSHDIDERKRKESVSNLYNKLCSDTSKNKNLA